jgi:small subunit ribosomal protein S15e
MADSDNTAAADAEKKKKRQFRKYTYRGIELEQLLDMTIRDEQLLSLLHCRARRKLLRGLRRKHISLLRRLRKAKKNAPLNDKPAVIKTHLRDMLIVPEMVGSVIGIHNGKTFNQVEIKACQSCSPSRSVFI